MRNGSKLFTFTENLSELLRAGLNIKKAVYEMKNWHKGDKKMARFCDYLLGGLNSGKKLSYLLMNCVFFKVPVWYSSLIFVAEESGAVNRVFCFLEEVLKEKLSKTEKLISGLIYPVLMMLFSTGVALFAGKVFFALPQVQKIWNPVELFCPAGMFCFLTGCWILFVVLFFIRKEEVLYFFNALAFLAGENISLVVALGCAFNVVEFNRNLKNSVIEVRRKIKNGNSVSEVFAEGFVKVMDKKERTLLKNSFFGINWSGDSRSFNSFAKRFKEKILQQEKMIFKVQEPVFLALTGIYILVLMRKFLLPLILGEVTGL